MGNITHADVNVRHAFGNMVHAALNFGHAVGNVEQAVNDAIDAIIHAFGNVIHAGGNVVHFIDNFVPDVGRAASAVITFAGNIISWFAKLPGKAVSALSALGGDLRSLGRNAMSSMWSGIRSVGSSILGWFGGFINSIVGFFKKILGIHSPSSVFYELGKNMMLGLEAGIKAHAHTAANAARQAAQGALYRGKFGSGVAQWAGLVRQALSMEGLSPGLVRNVLYQMMTESGGNPNAINLTDSNAAAGDPSRGLMQTIGATFTAYHWPGTSWDIYNPLANIAAALNYARHRYGPTLMSGGMGIGSGHGYRHGGWLAEAVRGVGMTSGEPYMFHGNEAVTSEKGLAPLAGLLAGIRDDLAMVASAVYTVAPDTAGGVASVLGGAAKSAHYASLYGA